MALLRLLILSLSTASLLFGQTPTATPPPDSDGDGVPDHKDGWPQHKQLTTPPVPECQYVAIDLGHGTGYGINNLGDVVGEAYNDNGEWEAILWRLGQPPTFLGFLTQDQTFPRRSTAWAINDAGVITGNSIFTWDPTVTETYPTRPVYPQILNGNGGYWGGHAFRRDHGAMTDLNDLSFGTPESPDHPNGANKLSSSGSAINNSGAIVGSAGGGVSVQATDWYWLVVAGFGHPVSYNSLGAPSDLNVTPAETSYGSDAVGINDRGMIVGYGAIDGRSAFFISGPTPTPTPGATPGPSPEAIRKFFDPGTENGYAHVAFARGLNNLDHVIGSSDAAKTPFIWFPTSTLPEDERIIDLGALSLAANFQYTGADAINDRDQIVGSGSFGGTGNREALLWQNGKLHRLNDLIGLHPNFNLEAAPAINQGGMIVAHAPNSSDGEAFLLVPDELLVDANNDGKMSFTNAAVHNKDKTTKHAPYQFWINNDRDEGDTDVSVDGLPDWTKDVIDQERDLEDFSRLWISFKGLTGLVKSPGVQLQLEWQPNDGSTTWRATDGNPAIKLFQAAEADGGRRYLEKKSWTITQTSPPYNTTYGLVRRDYPLILSMPSAMLSNLTEEQPNLYLLFEGVASGKGRLVLKLLKNGQKLAEYPPLYLELKDVKDMYEQWTVGDVMVPNKSIASSLDYQVWPTSTPTQTFGPSKKPMPAPKTDAENDYILMVHGWNMSPFDKESVGDTAFKRLFWQGFNGRFGLFRWPTFFFTGRGAPPLHHFDASEHRAWASSLGLLSLINQLNNGTFGGKVRIMAHSMGNVVAGEALRRSQSGQVVHTYVASQAAISAHCYDATTPLITFPPFSGPTTPDVYAYYWQESATSRPDQWQSEGRPGYMHPDYMLGKAGRYFNYYNVADYALNIWQVNQSTKPDSFYGYVTSGFPPSVGFWRDPGYGATWLTFPTDRYEIFAWAAESRSYALGAQSVNGVVTSEHNFDLKTKLGYKDARKYHSAQFQDANYVQDAYWKQLFEDFQIKKASP